MGFFSKTVIKEMQLPYIVDDFTEPKLDDAAASISIEVYAHIDGENKYLYNTFMISAHEMCDDKTYYKMLEYEQFSMILIMVLSLSGAFSRIIGTGVNVIFNLLAGPINRLLNTIL